MSLAGVLPYLTDDEAAERVRIAERLEGNRYFPTARDTQLPPAGDWATWLIVAGRGFGKTRVGAEWVTDQALDTPGTRWAILAPTFADCRDTCVEGESGVLSVLERRGVPRSAFTWNRSIGELTLPNRSRMRLFSTDEPERLRGPQHHGAWCDEPASWVRGTDAWDMLSFGLRLGDHPQVVVTGTPKPVPLVRSLIGRADEPDSGVRLTRGSTFDNAANLAPQAVAELRRRYEGTRLGRQELEAELLTDVEGALWSAALIDEARVHDHPDLARVVVAIDPSGGDGDGHDEQGIIVAGIGVDGDFYVLADRSCKETPHGWASRAIAAFHTHDADRVIAEVNYGGQMVRSTLRQVDHRVPVKEITASRGKAQRAEPVAALYEQHRVHHVGGFAELEDQMSTWVPGSGKSPDRMDALVWAITELSGRAFFGDIAPLAIDRAEPGWSTPGSVVDDTGWQQPSLSGTVGPAAQPGVSRNGRQAPATQPVRWNI